MSKLPDTICSAPFFKLELDNAFRFRPCCKFEGGYKVDEKFSFEDAWNSQGRKNLIKDWVYVICSPLLCAISNFQAFIPSVCLPFTQDNAK